MNIIILFRQYCKNY